MVRVTGKWQWVVPPFRERGSLGLILQRRCDGQKTTFEFYFPEEEPDLKTKGIFPGRGATAIYERRRREMCTMLQRF